MDPNLEMRIASEDDLNQLAKMRWDARAEGGEDHTTVGAEDFNQEFIRVFNDRMRDGILLSWIALLNGSAVAQISIYKVRLFPRPVKLVDQFGIIIENYTYPKFRNRGIGSDLMRHAMDWARGQDYELLIVYPSQEARAFYARAGFQERSEVMELRLKEY